MATELSWPGRNNSDTLISAIFDVAASDPERPLFQPVDGETVSYRGAEEHIYSWANRFRALGVGPGDRVGFMLGANITSAVAPLGAALLGAWEVPVNAGYRGAVLRHIVEDAGLRVLVVTAPSLAMIEQLGELPAGLKQIVVVGRPGVTSLPADVVVPVDRIDAPESREGFTLPKPWDVSGLMYTSGTTGPAKGVVLPWGSWTAAFEFMAHLFTEDEVLYAPFPFYHGLARVSLTAAAMLGARVVVRESFKTQHFWADVDTFGCTFTATTPTVLQWLLNEPAGEHDLHHPLRRILAYGPQLLKFAERFGTEMSSMFAMTEVGSVVVYNDRDLPPGTSGKPRPDYDVRVVDEFDQEVPVGDVGELIVRSDRPWTTNLGYYGLPEESLHAWRNGWYHTGDNFRVDDDGFYAFADRKKDMIRRRGVNISSFQIESAVLEYTAVHEAAAIGVPSPDGEEDIKIFVVEQQGFTIQPDALHKFLRDALPTFMVPRYIEIVADLPKTPVTFRVRKHLLRGSPLEARGWDATVSEVQA